MHEQVYVLSMNMYSQGMNNMLIEIVSDDKGAHFFNETIQYFLDKFMVVYRKSSRYHL